MAATTTLFDLAKQKRDSAKQAVTDTQTQLTKAQTDAANNRTKLATATAKLAKLNAELDATRAKLGEVQTQPDGEALLDSLELLIIRARTQQANILEIGKALAQAQSTVNREQAAVASASADLATAEANLTQTTADKDERDKWIKALGEPPLAALSAKAANAKTVAPFTDAQTRINDIPAKLLERARSRRKIQADWIAQQASDAVAAEDAIVTERSSSCGLEGAANDDRLAFTRAATDAKEFVRTAKDRFDQAIVILTQVAADKSHPLLTAEQSERIKLSDARDKAADAERTVDSLRIALTNKQAAFSKEALKAKPDAAPQDALVKAKGDLDTAEKTWRKEEVDLDPLIEDLKKKEAAVATAIQDAIAAKKKPDDAQGVKDARAALAKAKTKLGEAEGTYRQSQRGILHTWEAAVPDTVWQAFDDFERATQILDELAAAKPDDLVKKLGDAEKAYVTSRLKADASLALLSRLAAEQTQREKLQQDSKNAAGTQLLSALRGDN